MIKFNNLSKEAPYHIFRKRYNDAFALDQKNIEAIAVSSYDIQRKEVDSRYVNLKLIENNKFIFFSNYDSPKASSFNSHNQIAALLYWSSINIQIRMKAQIKKTSKEFNQKYFFERSEEKNALAISSNQSKPIDSYDQVKENYNKSFESDDLKKCPEYWGGYSFTPYYFEFWEGNENRLNKRESFALSNKVWTYSILQP